jgi:hypothetical protein
MGPTINSSSGDAFPRISPDGLDLYFASWRPGGYGDIDIYVAKRATVKEPWGEPVNLGPTVNSAYGEYQLVVSPDGRLLFFTDNWLASPRPGGHSSQDIWMSRRASLSDPWETPVNLGSRLNEGLWNLSPCISVDGRTFYYHTASTLDPSTWDAWQVPIIPICDFNGDGQVDGKDLLCMAAQWGTDDPVCDIGPYAWGDGIVDLQDIIALGEHIGKEVIDPKLVAHWALDETEGSAAYDSVSGEAAHVLGDPVWEPTGGQVDGAVRLDGVDDCIIVASVLNSAKGPFSVLAWVKGGAPGEVIISEPRLANWLMVDAEGKLTTELRNPSQNGAILQSQTIITDGKWHRIALIWDGSRRMLCVDGVVAAEDTQETPPSSGSGLYIGTGAGMEAGSFFSGLIDDVRIYNRAVRP